MWAKFCRKDCGYTQGILNCTIDFLLTGLESAVWLLTIFVFICKTDKSKPVKQEVNGTVILPPFSILCYRYWTRGKVSNCDIGLEKKFPFLRNDTIRVQNELKFWSLKNNSLLNLKMSDSIKHQLTSLRW